MLSGLGLIRRVVYIQHVVYSEIQSKWTCTVWRWSMEHLTDPSQPSVCIGVGRMVNKKSLQGLIYLRPIQLSVLVSRPLCLVESGVYFMRSNKTTNKWSDITSCYVPTAVCNLKCPSLERWTHRPGHPPFSAWADTRGPRGPLRARRGRPFWVEARMN